MTKGERYRNNVRCLPCEICVRLHGMDPAPWHVGPDDPPPSAAHHPRTGAGAGRKSSDMDCIALCWEHHQGDTGVHGLGRKEFERLYGVTEAELTESTRRRVAEMRR